MPTGTICHVLVRKISGKLFWKYYEISLKSLVSLIQTVKSKLYISCSKQHWIWANETGCHQFLVLGIHKLVTCCICLPKICTGSFVCGFMQVVESQLMRRKLKRMIGRNCKLSYVITRWQLCCISEINVSGLKSEFWTKKVQICIILRENSIF